MPDGGWSNPLLTPPWVGWSGASTLPPPEPPYSLGPDSWRPTALSDAWGVLLADPSGDIIGMDGDLGRGGPLANVQSAIRSDTRNL